MSNDDPDFPQATLDALRSELVYHRKRANDWDHRNKPSFEAELLVLEELVQQLRTAWYTHEGNNEAAHVVRKIGGVAVRCMNNHGAFKRNP